MMHLLSLLFSALLCQASSAEKSIIGLYGGTVEIPCTFEANKIKDVTLTKWKYENVDLLVKSKDKETVILATDEYKDRISLAANLSLLLTGAKLTDQHTFTCQALITTNFGPNIKDFSHALIVHKAPEAPFITEKAAELEIGKLTKLGKCIAKNANPPAKIVWLRNNKALTNEENRTVIMVNQTSGSLDTESTLLYSARKEDTGAQFSCRAEHSLASGLVSPPETFVINYSTEKLVLEVISNSPPVEGNDVTLKCVADGNPRPTSFNFHIKGNVTKVENSDNYTIANISRKDSGEYKCSLIDHPSIEAAKNITVQYLDVKLNLDKTVIRHAGNSLNLNVSIDSSDTATVSWTKGGVKINKEPEIAKLAYSDAGLYELEVTMGPLSRKASFRLTVEGAPVIRKLDDQNDKDGHRKVLICEAEGSPKPAVSWNINGTLIDEKSFDNGTIKHKISVMPSANLSVACTVSNSFGIDTRVITVSSLFEDVKVDKRDSSDDDDKTKLVVGVVIGLLVAALVIGMAYWMYMKKSKQGSWKTGEKENGSSEEEKKLEEKMEENSQKADV
ncbi:PREDICTED: CD166 antigen isoform X1 [Poecilia mexicana]|uniref:Ig-like domain-containing protein n=1 Tax=Poecilia mexicana TaxID=48701 RepID=A0A3B3Y0G1_9TELE|nr:PREDICTED: CD166 antigen isoform X1 [Poecilia mexicana]XP_014835899.1 PREDICTED: CD166 antigen isoform X1 [Poecilia mexicana]